MLSNNPNQQRILISKGTVQIALCILTFLVGLGGTTSCSKHSKGADGAILNDSIALDSTVTKENKNVKVDPALVRDKGIEYILYESSGNEDDAVRLVYTIEHDKKCTNYCGTLYYPNKKDTSWDYEIGMLGEVADDGGLVFKGKLDNVLYVIHIKNTHNTASSDNDQKHEVELTVGDKKRIIYMKFDNAGDSFCGA